MRKGRRIFSIMTLFTLSFSALAFPGASIAVGPPPSSPKVEKILDAAIQDRYYLASWLTDPSKVKHQPGNRIFGIDSRLFASPASVGLVPLASEWVTYELSSSHKAKYLEQSPGDPPGLNRATAMIAWQRACLYLPIFLEGFDINYPYFNDIVNKHKNDTDGGVALANELRSVAESPTIKDKGVVSEIFRLVRTYANLLEQKQADVGVAYLLGLSNTGFAEFMADMTQFAIGWKPISENQCMKSGKSCVFDNNDCNEQSGDYCNPNVRLGNPCLMVLSNIVSTAYIGSTLWYPSEVTIVAPKGIPFESAYQKLRGEMRMQMGDKADVAANNPCLLGSNDMCVGGIRALSFSSPANEKSVIEQMIATTNRMSEYKSWLEAEIARLQAVPEGKDNPVVGLRGGSVISLPLPLSNISVPTLVGRVINAILGIVGAIALLMFVWGGLQWMLASGNPEGVGKAKKTIVWAALGIVAIFSSYAVINLVIEAFSK